MEEEITLLTEEEQDVARCKAMGSGKLTVEEAVAKAQLAKVLSKIENIVDRGYSIEAFGPAIISWLKAAKKEIE